MTTPHIAFLGIGLMGAPMTRNLLKAGFSMTLWNRTPAKAAAFAGEAQIASSATEAVSDVDVIIVMLENGPVVNEVLFQSGAYQMLKSGALVIDMSSIPPATAREHGRRLAEHGIRYLDAPVSGGTVGAAEARLSIMAGGDKPVFDAAQPVLRALGKSTYIGPTGSGQLAKLANQCIVGITIGAVSEALLLAAQGGADPVAVRDALMGGFASSRILDLHGQRMLDRNFTPGATARVQLKDLQMILDEARGQGMVLPLAQRVYESYRALVASGQDNVDHSGLLLQLEALNQTSLLHPSTKV